MGKSRSDVKSITRSLLAPACRSGHSLEEAPGSSPSCKQLCCGKRRLAVQRDVTGGLDAPNSSERGSRVLLSVSHDQE